MDYAEICSGHTTREKPRPGTQLKESRFATHHENASLSSFEIAVVDFEAAVGDFYYTLFVVL